PPAASIHHPSFTTRLRYKTAWSSLQGELTAMVLLPRAPNCTTRRAGPGLPQAVSTRHAVITRRRCYKTAWCLLQGDLTATKLFLRARNWDMVTAKIHWEGSKKRPSRSLNHLY